MENKNVLLAEFMGRRGKVNTNLFWVNIEGVEWVKESELKFHKSKRWLNAVLDKIETLLSENIREYGYSDECLYSKDKEVRYIAMCEFVEWYNALIKTK